MARRAHVAVLGDAFVDIFLPVGGGKLPFWGGDVLLEGGVGLKPGGSASNTASHLAKLAQDPDDHELEVSLHTALGSDEWAAMIEKHHAATGVELVATRLAEAPTGVCVVLSGNEDRAFMTQAGTMAALTSEMLDMEKLQRAKHLHIGGFFSVPRLQAGLAALVRELRAARPELTVSLDTNYDASGTWGRGSPGHLGDLLREVDVFLPNETEACAIAETQDVREAARRLSERLRAPLGAAIVTHGAEGCVVACRSLEGDDARTTVAEVRAPRVERVVDATGAGDAFNAAFLHAWIRGASLEDAARQGVVGGAVAVSHEGACDTLLTGALLAQFASASAETDAREDAADDAPK